METRYLRICDIQPHVRIVNLYQCQPGYDSGTRRLYDHYFLYVHRGLGTFIIDGIPYEGISGDLFFCRPSVPNQIIAGRDDPFLLSGIDFDFTSTHRDKAYFRTIQAKFFDPRAVTEYVEFRDFPGFPPKLQLAGDTNIRDKMLDMAEQFTMQRRYYDIYVNGLFQSFLARVIQHIEARQLRVGHLSQRIDEILGFIGKVFREDISNQEIADTFHYHPDHINRIVYSFTGMTIRQYIIDLRVREAIQLLLSTNLSITAIAAEVGYTNTHYFARLFKAKTGHCPSRFRNESH